MTTSPFSVFVGGPIQNAIGPDGAFDGGTRSVIEEVIAGLQSHGHVVFSAHVHQNFSQREVSRKFQEVCHRDFQWMLACDVFVAVLPLDSDGNVVNTGGTSIELGWASALRKPVILVCDPAPKYSHLVIGLDAVARVTKIDINRTDLETVLPHAVAEMLALTEPTSSPQTFDQSTERFSPAYRLGAGLYAAGGAAAIGT